MDQLALHINDFEMRVNDKFQVVHEMFGKLDKKLDMVLKKVAEVDQKITEIVPPSAGPSVGPVATNHEYVKDLKLTIRKYQRSVLTLFLKFNINTNKCWLNTIVWTQQVPRPYNKI